MDSQTIMQLVSNLGFPIVVCIALFWLVIKVNENYNTTIDKLRETIDKNSKLIDDVLDELKERSKK